MQKEAEFEILADIPGVQKSAVQLDVDKDILTLSISGPNDTPAEPAAPATDAEAPTAEAPAAEAAAEGTETQAHTQPQVLRQERTQRHAKRSLRLPETADLLQAQATCESGVLTVRVPKKALPSPQRITIA